jgi:hypothetical protein
MTNERDESRDAGRDEAWPGVMQWSLGPASAHVGETLWQCDALRAGRLYSRSLFATQAEAEAFALRMRDAEPDQMFSVEAIKASAVWN